jgi:hypothetical protein
MVSKFLTQSITQKRLKVDVDAIDPNKSGALTTIATFSGFIRFNAGNIVYSSKKATEMYDYLMTCVTGQDIRAKDIITCDGKDYEVITVTVSPITPKSFEHIDTYGLKFIGVEQ